MCIRDRPYSAAHDRGLLWDDPALAIDWPVATDTAIISDKDRHQPALAELDTPFAYRPPQSAAATGA